MTIKNEFNEIYLVSEGGLPLFYYNADKPEMDDEDDEYVMQAGFLSAINQFGMAELGQDEVKYVVFDQKGYIYTKKTNFVVIFSKIGENLTQKMKDLEETVQEAGSYVEEILETTEFARPPDKFGPKENEKLAARFNQTLRDNKTIVDETEYDAQKAQSQVKKAIFRSIGYKPGECNIGPVERQKRLIQGLSFILVGLLGYLAIIYFKLPDLLILALFFPFIMGFMGFYQYFFKFCVNNALNKRYQMR